MARGQESMSYPAKRRSATVEEARSWVAGLADALGQPADPGIAEPLVAFRLLGYEMTASCQGHKTRGHANPESGTPYPWIDMEVDSSEREEISSFLPTFHFVKKGSQKYPKSYRLVPREVRDITDSDARGHWDERLMELNEFAEQILRSDLVD